MRLKIWVKIWTKIWMKNFDQIHLFDVFSEFRIEFFEYDDIQWRDEVVHLSVNCG